MDRGGWLKAATQFSDICGASPSKNQILFLNVHDGHFYKRSLIQMKSENIQPLIIKAGESINDHTNDHGPNSKLKALYKNFKD